MMKREVEKSENLLSITVNQICGRVCGIDRLGDEAKVLAFLCRFRPIRYMRMEICEDKLYGCTSSWSPYSPSRPWIIVTMDCRLIWLARTELLSQVPFDVRRWATCACAEIDICIVGDRIRKNTIQRASN